MNETPSVTAACIGGACSLCPGVSNTGVRCECSHHDTAPIRCAARCSQYPACRHDWTAWERIVTRGGAVTRTVPVNEAGATREAVNDQYIMANADRCTVHPQHVMVNQGRDESLYGDVSLCACGERSLGNTDERKVRPVEDWTAATLGRRLPPGLPRGVEAVITKSPKA